MSRKKIALVLFLIIVFGFVIRLNLFQIPFERDEGGWAYIGRLILTGTGVPYKDAFDHKPPGVHFMYALLLAVCGKTPAAIHIGSFLYSVITTVGLYFLAARVFDRSTGLLSAFCFVFLSSARDFLGFSTSAEIFMVMPLVLGTLLTIIACEKKSLLIFAVVGFLSGCAFMFKQVAATNILFIALYILYDFWKSSERRISGLFCRYLLLFTFFWIPILAFVLYFYLNGALGEAYRQTILFNLDYVGARAALGHIVVSALRPFIKIRLSEGRAVLLAFSIFSAYWALCLYALVRIIWKRHKRLFFAGGFLLFSFAGVAVGFIFRAHYFIQTLPALSILAAWGIIDVCKGLTSRRAFSNPVVKAALIFLLAAVLLLPIAIDAEYYFFNTPERNVAKIYRSNPFAEAPHVAGHLEKNTSPGDKVVIFGSEPEVLFYANRYSATKHLIMYSLVGSYKNAFEKQAEMIEEVTRARPAYAVVFNPRFVPLSWLYLPENANPFFDWMEAYLQKEYELDGLFYKDDYRRSLKFSAVLGEKARALPPRFVENCYIHIYKRKE